MASSKLSHLMPVPCPIDTLDLDFRNLSVVSKNEETVNEIVVNVEKNCKIIINDSINEKNKSCIVKNIKKAEDIKKKKLLKVKAESLIKLLRSDEDRENKFVVSKEQREEVQSLFEGFFKNFYFWYEFFPQKGVKKLPVLFSPFKKGNRAIFKDQEARAKFIVDYMSKNNNMELVTMDGHTRLMYLLVDYAKKREQELKIHLVDIDDNTNEFHKIMLPKEVFESNKQSIVVPDQCYDILDWSTEYLKNIKNPFLYLNFCGISCCRKGKEKGRDRVNKFIKKWLENHEGILLSVSLRPHGFIEYDQGMLTNYGMVKQYNSVEISQRGHFVTYFIKSNPKN